MLLNIMQNSTRNKGLYIEARLLRFLDFYLQKMIDYNESLSIVNLYLKELEGKIELSSKRSKIELMLIESATLEKTYGWIFFYNSRQYIEEGNMSLALAGNTPLIVERRSGKLTVTGTARSIEYYSDLYEKQGFI